MKKMMQILTLSACVLGMAACGNNKEDAAAKESSETTASSTTTTTSSSAEKEYQTVGVKSDTALEALVKNNTGKEIKAVAIKAEDQADFPENMMAEDDTIKNSDTVELFYTPENKDKQEKYLMQITFADDTVKEIRDLDFAAVAADSEVELNFADDVAFLKYKNKDGVMVDTKETEVAVKNQKEQEAAATQAADTQAQADAEAAAAAQAQAAVDADAAAAANAQAQADANAAAAAQAQADANAAAAAQAQAQAAADAAAAAAQQQQQQPTPAPTPDQGTDNCLDL